MNALAVAGAFGWPVGYPSPVSDVLRDRVLPEDRRRTGGGGVEGGDADEVVDGGGDLEPGPVALSAEVAEFAAAADGLDPAEGFLDPFPDPHADTAWPAWRVVRPSIAERCRVVFWATCGVNPSSRAPATKPSGVVALVPGDGAAPSARGEPGEHLDRGGPLGVAVGGGQLGVDDQRVAVLHQQVPRVAQRRRGRHRLGLDSHNEIRRLSRN